MLGNGFALKLPTEAIQLSCTWLLIPELLSICSNVFN